MNYEREMHFAIRPTGLARILQSKSKWRVPAFLAAAFLICLIVFGLLVTATPAHAQLDQGTISGLVTDPNGRVIPNATVTLKEVDTGVVFTGKTDSTGFYNFSPIKIGNYSISAEISGFQTTTETGLALHASQRLNVNLSLTVGSTQSTVTVNANQEPLLQTEQASTGQTVTAEAINDMPLNGRNYVFEAQLVAGVQQALGSRGLAGGDFSANGQRPTENNFILDGVDNNSNAVDFLNGASYVVKPPPDALAEFSLETGSYDAEFGHSAGAVVNVSIKSGTNDFHGNLWEYVRNNDLGAVSEFQTKIAPYHQNQFGATLGGPILKRKLFFFGDSEATRIVYGEPSIRSVPTPLMRTGNFSELLNPALTGQSAPIQLYNPGSGGGPGNEMSCSGQNNVLCNPNPIALKVLAAFPLPNLGNGLTYNNYYANTSARDNTVTWDGRIDWNISSTDQAFARMSESLEHQFVPPPLGSVLDGGGYANGGSALVKGLNGELSETHVFAPTFVNEFRIADNAGHFEYVGPAPNTNESLTFGMGGFPGSAPGEGGLPFICVGFGCFGTIFNYPADEHEGVPQLLDNVTKTIGKQSIRFGYNVSRVESSVLSPQWGRGILSYSGQFTGTPGVANTGNGTADFVADMMTNATVSHPDNGDQIRWTQSAYVQDDWKVTPKLTLNVGLRYDYYSQPYEKNGQQANFVPLTQGIGTGTGQYLLPSSDRTRPSATLYPGFVTPAAKDNIATVYSGNQSLSKAQKTNFSPRFGVEYAVSKKLVLRTGFGMFYSGAKSFGEPNVLLNYPFNFNDNFVSPSCATPGVPCAADDVTLEGGFAALLPGHDLNNMAQSVSNPALSGFDADFKTTYSMQYNLSTEYAFNNTLTATVGYVGSVSRHLVGSDSLNIAAAIAAPGTNMQPYAPFPDFSSGYFDTGQGIGAYNSLQATLKKRYSTGLYFLATYTWSHMMDDLVQPLGDGQEGYPQNIWLIPLEYEYQNSPEDIRQRFNFSGNYQLPFGLRQRYLNTSRLADKFVGGWAITPVITAQTGNPFTVSPSNFSAPSGSGAYAILTGDPFKGGGSPNPTNPTISCPASVRNKTNWFNPCAFSNPKAWDQSPGTLITTAVGALPYLGSRADQIAGPGYYRINSSVFKNFSTYESQYLQFRMDVFNLFNHPALGQPNGSITNTAGLITSTRTTGKNQPDARFFQLALKYNF